MRLMKLLVSCEMLNPLNRVAVVAYGGRTGWSCPCRRCFCSRTGVTLTVMALSLP